MESAAPANAIRFGVFEFDKRSGELRKQGRRVRLEGQPVGLLIKLLEHPGELVTREDLQKELWPGRTFVNFEQSLNAAVKRLRHALGDSASNPRFVETLARRGYRFIAPVSALAGGPAGPPPTAPAIESLAVLPFDNADTETEYLADGITESIINQLSQFSGIRVMSRSAVFRYKDKTLDPRTVGRKLNVSAVLLGRIAQRGDALHVRVELADVRNGWQLWGEQYNRPLADIFAVEEEIAREISGRLRLRLTVDNSGRSNQRHPRTTEAYQDYLKGRYHLNRLSEEGLRKGIEHLQSAIRRDPGYALAYTGLADAYGLLGFFGLAPASSVMPQAKQAAGRAVEIDDSLAEAHISLAGIYKNYDWDWAAAQCEFDRAFELDPNQATGRRVYAAFLASHGRREEALNQIHIAQELDPLSLNIMTDAAWNSYVARDYERAAREAQRALELEPQFAAAQSALGLVYEQQGRYAEAAALMDQARYASGNHPATLAALVHIHAAAGSSAESAAALDLLKAQAKQRHVSPCWMAIAYAGLSRLAEALDFLERAYEQHDVILVWLKTDPRFDALRAERRFTALLESIGMLPSSESMRLGA